MLYIFQVDTGSMITLDMNLALETVANLKRVISQACKIPEEKQVLLISGGYSLDPGTRVCNYSAGTDTSPIFLFNKVAIEDMTSPINARWEASEEGDMKEKVEGSLSMPPTYNTVVSRTQLAQQFYELAKDGKTNCERLVLDQHLMQQGWAAVIANLDDVTSVFKIRSEKFEKTFNQYLETRPSNIRLLENFSQDLALLSKIPVLPILLKASQDEASGNDVATVNLLHWISSKDNQNSLEQIAEISKKGIEKFDAHVLKGLLSDVQKALSDVDNPEMKEIKGLEERLCGLEQLMFQAKKTVDEQGGLAQALLHNQNRVSSLKDPSIFPDLCASHKQQLLMLLQNHERLQDIHRRCLIAKKELCFNLHTRLRWIMWVEGQLSDIDNKLTIYIENLKRIKSHLEVVQQIHLAPRVYLATVSEVVRRRDFSKMFLEWAGQLSQQSLSLHQKEVQTRKHFNSQLTNHFLLSLFPGMDDSPPPFATQAPSEFDASLPCVEGRDVELLRKALPDFVNYLRVSQPCSSLFNNLSSTTFTHDSQTPVSASTQTMTSESGVDTLTRSENSKSSESLGVKDGRKPSISESQREAFSPISEEVWLGEDFETVAVDKLDLTAIPSTSSKPPKSKMESAGSEPGPAQRSEELQLTLHRAHSEGDIESSPLELPTEPTNFAQDFMTADFYIDESMPSSYTESNGTSGLARSATGGQMTKSHHVVVAELQKQLDDKVMSISSMQEDLKAKNDQLEKHTSSLSSLNDTLREILLKDRQSLFQLKQQILEDKTRVSGEIGELVDSIAAVFFELKNELENEKSAKKNLEKTLQERILSDLSRLDNIFLKDEELQRHIRENQIDLINEDSKQIDFEMLFEVRRVLDAKRVLDDEMTQRLEIEDRARVSEKRYEELMERFEACNNHVKYLREKMLEDATRWEEIQHDHTVQLMACNKNLREREEEMVQTVAALKTQHQKEVQEAVTKVRKTFRQMPMRLSLEEVNRMWLKAGEDALKLVHQAWNNERISLEDQCSQLHDSLSRTTLVDCVQMFILSIDKKSQEVCQAQWNFWAASNEMFARKCVEFLSDIKKQCIESDSLKLESFDTSLALILRLLQSYPRDPIPPNCTLQVTLKEFEKVIQQAQREFEENCQLVLNKKFNKKVRTLEDNLKMTDDNGKGNSDILTEFDPLSKNQMTASVQTEQNAPASSVDQCAMALEPFNPTRSLPTSKSLTSTSKSLPPSTSTPSREGSALLHKLLYGSRRSSASFSPPDPFTSPNNKVSVLKCSVNDLVLLTYDNKHENYVVFVMEKTPHFLNQDCHAELGLILEPGKDRQMWALGVVVDKEYCKAKKVPNRYRVSLDSRFFRVTVRRWEIPTLPSTSCSPT